MIEISDEANLLAFQAKGTGTRLLHDSGSWIVNPDYSCGPFMQLIEKSFSNKYLDVYNNKATYIILIFF